MLVKQTGKYLLLFVTGGLLYNIIELLLRGWSHWTMFILGGVCFICLGLINELLPWTLPRWKQMLLGAAVITYFELITDCPVTSLGRSARSFPSYGSGSALPGLYWMTG